jgi:glycosyltransferase involved in cell wall biosynthesis
MQVLLDHPCPFQLAHGGLQIQIEQTFRGLKEAGVKVDWLRWWDERQRPDVIHYVGRPPLPYLEQAHGKGIKVVLAELLTGAGSRSRFKLMLERQAIRLGRLTPYMVHGRFGWDAYRKADACIANTAWEAHLMSYLFGAAPGRVHVIPNGVEEVFLNSAPAGRGQWLVCSATITQRKRVSELAEAAVQARCPLWVLGRPYSESDPYAQRFLSLAKQQPQWVRYEGAVSDRGKLARIYREARGFVLLSTQETRSLASEEAAACGCPLLLSDLPWARSVYGEHARYCPVGASTSETAARLRDFYDAAPRIEPPPRPRTWAEVGGMMRAVYEGVFQSPR